MGHPDLAVRVQHHASRPIDPLLAALADFDDVAVLTDDTNVGDTWRTHQRCLEAMPDHATHLVVLQDDVLPQHNAAERTRAAATAHPTMMICLFTPGFGYLRKRVLQAQLAGQSTTRIPVMAFVPLVATVYPRDIVEKLLEWTGSHHRARRRIERRGADDGIVADFCRQHRIDPIGTVPSIFEHDDSVPSVAKTQRGGPHRRAALL